MFSRSRRLWQIQRIVRHYGLGDLVPRRAPRWLLGSGGDERPVGERIRLALEDLGPIFVKFGQAVSTRRDLLPPDIADELGKLQDRVPPFDAAEAKALIVRAYGQSLEAVFERFDDEPLAAASIAQVHSARLHPEPGTDEGRDVVVKVLRPGVHEAVERDLELLRLLADIAARLPETRRMRPREVVAEYERVVTDELDLIREGANASQLRRNWFGSDVIYHPEVLFEHTRENVLVMERIDGIPIDDTAALTQAGVDFRVLAERGVEIFFKQVFRDNFFHADMHPGNIFVDVSNPARPRYIGVDFGIVGSLTLSDQRYLAENFLAFFNRDYRRIAELHVASGWMPADTRIEAFQSAIRTVCEPIFNKPLAQISFGMFMVRLFQVARRFDYRVQPQLVLLQKTVLAVEGLGRELYPDLDLWDTAKPILEDWMRERMNPIRNLDRLRDQLPVVVDSLPELASAVVQFATREAAPERPDTGQALTEIRGELPGDAAALRLTVVGTGLVISAAVTAGLDFAMPWSAIGLAIVGLGCWWRGHRVARDARR